MTKEEWAKIADWWGTGLGSVKMSIDGHEISQKPLYSPKELKERAKIWGKRSKEARQKHFEYNIPYWRSFSSFKKHMTTHNTEINLIPESEAGYV